MHSAMSEAKTALGKQPSRQAMRMECCLLAQTVPEKSVQGDGLAILLNVSASLEEAETSKLQPGYMY
jgi:hypothetical protein